MFHNADDDQSFFDYNNAELEDCLGSYLHDVGETEFRGAWARFQVDMGTCDELALDVLVNSLLGFSKDFFGLKKIYVGGVNKSWPVPEVDDEVEVRRDGRGTLLSVNDCRKGLTSFMTETLHCSLTWPWYYTCSHHPHI